MSDKNWGKTIKRSFILNKKGNFKVKFDDVICYAMTNPAYLETSENPWTSG